MFLSSKHLLDSAISRRTFIQRMTAAGISLAGAQAMAQSLLGAGGATDTLEPSRVLQGLTEEQTAWWNTALTVLTQSGDEKLAVA